MQATTKMMRLPLVLLVTFLAGAGPVSADNKAKERDKIEAKKRAEEKEKAEARKKAEEPSKAKAGAHRPTPTAASAPGRVSGPAAATTPAAPTAGPARPAAQSANAAPVTPAQAPSAPAPPAKAALAAPAPVTPAPASSAPAPSANAASAASAPATSVPPAAGAAPAASSPAAPATAPAASASGSGATAKPPAATPAQSLGSVVQLAGRWRSNAGAVYDITQSGGTFRWVVVRGRGQGQQVGAGTMKGSAIEASWTAPFAGASTGVVTAASGRAIRMKWRNGVVFIRDFSGEAAATSSPDPRVLQLTGRWSSSTGSFYDISQDGDTFRWVVVEGRGRDEQIGAGTIDGTAVEASWSAPFAGATTGIVTADGGRAIRIQWKNGATFIR